MDDDAILALVKRLGRPQPSRVTVIERAAILAEGADFEAVMAWILAQGGAPEEIAPKAARSGLYGSRLSDGGGATPARTPARFVLPAGALD